MKWNYSDGKTEINPSTKSESNILIDRSFFTRYTSIYYLILR